MLRLIVKHERGLGSRLTAVAFGLALAVVTAPVVVGYLAVGAAVLVVELTRNLGRRVRRLLPLGSRDEEPRPPGAGG